MGVDVRGQVGPRVVNDGSENIIRTAKTGELIAQDAHGRFYEANARGTVYSGGIATLTSISNVTFTTATLGATVTPIIGVYNPIGNTVNLVILQAVLGVATTALQATGTGPFSWATSITTAAVTTGNNPLNRRSLQPSGSAAKDLSNVAPTGMTPNLAVRFGSSLGGGTGIAAAVLGTAAGLHTPLVAHVENFDGGLIVPPGGVLALLGTTTGVAQSAVSSIVWEEVAV
jgi:hypothetical protein